MTLSIQIYHVTDSVINNSNIIIRIDLICLFVAELSHPHSIDQRGDGVMSVEVLGLRSADKQRKQAQAGTEVFYQRVTAQHEFIVSS